jgi:hypothetical protein
VRSQKELANWGIFWLGRLTVLRMGQVLHGAEEDEFAFI